ncbi:hypothetical protein AAFF_G00379960 [Aldrovandia affinis]|uniref:Uncharacterized protein n=1 Tax=Aldrovandia affinis TaxID=143900 RepID=A0AAD7T7Q2_9TELE|nr:hypothetical protein AAFF_G00379960 [Aldrovandia affinis]
MQQVSVWKRVRANFIAACQEAQRGGRARQVNKVWRYLEESGLQRCAERLCADALGRGGETEAPHTVPANPYPALTQRLRQIPQRLSLDKLSSDEIFTRAVSFPTTPTAVRHVSGAKGCSHVWGLPSILCCVSPQEMGRYRWLLEDVTPPLSKLGRHSPYTVQVGCALSGPCIFSGGLLPASPVPPLDLLQTYIIAGPDPRRALALYARCLRCDVIRMRQQGCHRVLRVTVPADDKGGIREEVCLQGSGLEEAVERCLERGGEGLVRVECVWRVDPQGTQYQGGSKTYCLTVVLIPLDHQQKERVLSFPQCPLLVLCCSVFPQQAQAEAYARAHLPPHAGSDVDVFAAVRDVIAGRLSALRLPRDALPSAHLCCALLLLSAQTHTDSAGPHTPPLETLAQLFRFAHSPAARLWVLRQHALTLCQLLQSRPAESADVEICTVLARQLQRLLQDYVTESDSGRSWCSDSRVSLESLRSRLQAVCAQLAQGPGDASLTALIEWCWSSSVLECQLVSDFLPSIPILSDLMHRTEESGGEQSALWEQELLYNTPRTVELRHTGDTSHLTTRVSQYLLDCAVDQCWERGLWTVLSASPFPCNPYPSLVQEFRLSSLRMCLWGQSDAEVLKQVWPPGGPQPCAAEGPLHCGPGGVGFGLSSALRASHPGRLEDCLRRAQSLQCETQRAGRFKVRRSTAVLSPRAWLGMVSPFLCGLQVVEFCYITAPPGCLDEVLQVYAKLVLAEVSELCGREGLIPHTVTLGPGQAWRMQEVSAFPTHFLERFIDALRQGHPVHLQVFQAPRGGAEWRFVPLQKCLVLYCLHSDGLAWLCLPHHDPLSLPRAVFPSLDQAAFHLRTAGRDPLRGGGLQEVMSQLDCEITDSFLRREILQGYRLLALRSLVGGRDPLAGLLEGVSQRLRPAGVPVCPGREPAEDTGTDLRFACALIQGLFELCEEEESSEPTETAIKCQGAIEDMFEGFSWLLRRTLQHPEALAPPGLWEAVLQGQEAGASRTAWVRCAVVVCRAISETLSHDLHSLCPRVQALLDRLGTAGERGGVRAQIRCTKSAPADSQPLPPPQPCPL